MDVDTFTSLQTRLREDARAELAAAHGDERKRLEEQITALNARLANPDEALAQQHAIILDLEAQLARRGNELGGDDVTNAKAALEAGDFTAARMLFETLAVRTEPDMQAHADASFALGQIAEAEIRWHDAAVHYARAAQLNPTFDTLLKARVFAWRAGDYPAALRFGEELLALARKSGTQEQLSRALNEHALTIKAQGRYSEAEGLYRQGLDIARMTIGDSDPDYATRLNNLANVVQLQGRYLEAEGIYRQALDIDRKTIGEAHQDYATHLNNLATVVQAQGRYPEAEKLFRQALEIARQTIGDAHPNYASGLNNLAGVVRAQRRYPEAEGLFRQALDIDRKTIGDAHPSYAIDLSNLASVMQAQGRHLDAEAMIRLALDIDRDTIGDTHPDYAIRLNNLAGAVLAQGRFPEAEGLYRQALAIIRNAVGDGHPDINTYAHNLITLLESHNPTAPDLLELRALRHGTPPPNP